MTTTEDKKFKYIICERVIDKLYDDKTLIKSVIFNISRYGRFNKKLIFYNFVTIRQAIENVEEYLSEKVTPDYYETIKDEAKTETVPETDKPTETTETKKKGRPAKSLS